MNIVQLSYQKEQLHIWIFQLFVQMIKTTGTAFSGNYDAMLEMLDNVINCMVKSRVRVKDKT